MVGGSLFTYVVPHRRQTARRITRHQRAPESAQPAVSFSSKPPAKRSLQRSLKRLLKTLKEARKERRVGDAMGELVKPKPTTER